MYEVKIPQARVACLIGKEGTMKKVIERSTNTRLRVSAEGDVLIEGESYDGYLCENVVRAIGRGFNPIIALQLVQENYALEIIEIKEVIGNKPQHLIRIRSRLIGQRGRARRVLERLTRCHICIYGKTVSLIGTYEHVSIATRGVKKLLHGSSHGNVYGFLERGMKKLKPSY